jgi:hypothetical protein
MRFVSISAISLFLKYIFLDKIIYLLSKQRYNYVNNYSPSKSEALKFSFRNITEIMALPRKKMAINGSSNIKHIMQWHLKGVKHFVSYA